MKKPRDDDEKLQAREAANRRRERDKQHLDERLDEALKETFPASDPIAVTPPRKAVKVS
jgi:hypothetical protein